jgi:hypothetical protein
VSHRGRLSRHKDPRPEFAITPASSRTQPRPVSCPETRKRARRPCARRAIRRRRRGPAASPLASPAHDQGRTIGADGPDQKGGVPLRSVHRGPVDQVHRAGPRACVMLASAPRQPSQSQSATWHTLSLSTGCLGNFTKRALHFLISQICPSTL